MHPDHKMAIWFAVACVLAIVGSIVLVLWVARRGGL